jgi:tetratricopeptide (TPR) repeat protein
VVYYILALVLFACGLMSKPMLVTLPCVLLLLDYWPLRRFQLSTFNFQLSTFRRLLVEKLPFFALSALDCIATLRAQRETAVIGLDILPLSARIVNSLVSYVLYLWKMVWPAKLAIVTPYSGHQFWVGVVAGILLVFVTALVAWRIRKYPFLTVGWLWYLGTLVPAVGLVQVGIQSMPDRYTYIPLIGIFVMIAWGAPELLKSCSSRGNEALNQRSEVRDQKSEAIGASPAVRDRGLRGNGTRWLLGSVAMAVLLALTLCTGTQLQFWHDSVSLFSHAIEASGDNVFAEYNLGEGLGRLGRQEDAMVHYFKALATRPNRLEVARRWQAFARVNLGGIYAVKAKWPEAEAQFRAIVEQYPDMWQARSNLADCLAATGRLDEAVMEYQSALQLGSTSSEAWRRLGITQARKGDNAEALRALREAVRLNPNGVLELNELAWFLATDIHPEVRNGQEAIVLALRACELTGRHEARCLGTLDAAYAEAGRFDDAVDTARQTQELALATAQAGLATAAEERLQLYRQGKPFRQQVSAAR